MHQVLKEMKKSSHFTITLFNGTPFHYRDGSHEHIYVSLLLGRRIKRNLACLLAEDGPRKARNVLEYGLATRFMSFAY